MTDSEITTAGINLNLKDLSAHIATELAAGLSSPEEIRARYGITEQQWEVLRKNHVFRHMVAESLQKLSGDLNAKERIKLKAALAVEDSILSLYKMVHDNTLPASARVDAQRQLSDLAEVGRRAPQVGEGINGKGGFTLILNFPTGQQMVEAGREPIDVAPERVALEDGEAA